MIANPILEILRQFRILHVIADNIFKVGLPGGSLTVKFFLKAGHKRVRKPNSFNHSVAMIRQVALADARESAGFSFRGCVSLQVLFTDTNDERAQFIVTIHIKASVTILASKLKDLVRK